ncbi:MAG: hypothetical protein WC506_02915 [Candidatus Micrarchaeia archaeon]
MILNNYNSAKADGKGVDGNKAGSNQATGGGNANNRTVRQQNIISPETNNLNSGRQAVNSGVQDMNAVNNTTTSGQNQQGRTADLNGASANINNPVDLNQPADINEIIYTLPSRPSFFEVSGKILSTARKILGSVLKKSLIIVPSLVVLKSVYDSFANTKTGFFKHLYNNGASVLSFLGRAANYIASSPYTVTAIAGTWFAIGSGKKIISAVKNSAENIAGRLFGVASELSAFVRNTSLTVLALTVASNAYAVVSQMANSSVVDPVKQIFDRSAETGTAAALALLISVPAKMIIDAVRNSVSNLGSSQNQH